MQVNNSVAEAAGRGEKLEQQQRAMLGSTSDLAAQANETMTLLQALAEEVGSAKVRAPQALPPTSGPSERPHGHRDHMNMP